MGYTPKKKYPWFSNSDYNNSILSENYSKWMSYIDDTINVKDLSIPGTHNSCSSKFKEPNNKVVKYRMIDQSWPIKDQLKAGIRYFDLRPGKDYMIYHSIYSTIYSLNQTLEEMVNFLKKYPSEFLFVRFQFTNSTCGEMDLEICRNIYLNSILSKYYKYFYIKKDFPEISLLRGKIYPFIEYTFFRNLTQWRTYKIKHFLLQDKYKFKGMIYILRPFYLNKKKKLISLYANKKDPDKRKLILNHCSMQNKRLKSTPPFVSFVTNEIIYKANNLRGIIIFDFPSELLIKHVINSNRLNSKL